MKARPASTTVAYFVFRFAALAALTIGVLASVSVRASRDDRPSGSTTSPAPFVPETAETVNARRYPPVYADAAPRH